MERYKNLGGDSGVSSYEIASSSIKIKFKDTAKIYVYTYFKPEYGTEEWHREEERVNRDAVIISRG